jgi:hypothetical protein
MIGLKINFLSNFCFSSFLVCQQIMIEKFNDSINRDHRKTFVKTIKEHLPNSTVMIHDEFFLFKFNYDFYWCNFHSFMFKIDLSFIAYDYLWNNIIYSSDSID